MLNAKSFLAVDFGAANLKLAEFELSEAGGLRVQRQQAVDRLSELLTIHPIGVDQATCGPQCELSVMTKKHLTRDPFRL